MVHRISARDSKVDIRQIIVVLDKKKRAAHA